MKTQLMPFIILFAVILCSSTEVFSQNPPNYCENFEDLDDLPLAIIKVNFHFILDKDGANNYNANDNGLGDDTRNGLVIAAQILDNMNGGFVNMQQMNSKRLDNTDHPHITKLGVQYQLYTNQDICEINDAYGGIWFWNYDEYDVTQPIVDGQAEFLPVYLKSLFGQYGENVLDIFIIGSRFYYPEGSNIPRYTIGGEASGSGSGSSLRVHNMWKFAEQDGLGNQIVLGPTINHEVGHVLFDIGHNGDGVANESDINVTDESTDGNNLMTYAGCACAVSVVQFSKIRKSLSKINVPFLDQSDLCTFNQTPIVIPENTYVIWDSYRELTQNVIVEPTATLRITCDIKTLGKFVVKRGAKLIVDGASISNLCEENNWRGIEVWGNPGKEHPTGSDPEGDLVDYDLESDDPGVVYLSGATLITQI